ncbi:hypothetical protein [Micromonospora sp. WMMD737]|uniref:hypothetical protein n=1 Tax=Micromonospora sp. WMMD737 TaxID=3404113 RepID=UPI003B9332FB
MLGRERPVVVAVCGSPGAGKTTVAIASARRLGLPLLTRDELKTGLGLSSASVTQGGDVQLDSDLSHTLLDALITCGARVLAVHVVADEAVIRDRLRARAVSGAAVD